MLCSLQQTFVCDNIENAYGTSSEATILTRTDVHPKDGAACHVHFDASHTGKYLLYLANTASLMSGIMLYRCHCTDATHVVYSKQKGQHPSLQAPHESPERISCVAHLMSSALACRATPRRLHAASSKAALAAPEEADGWSLHRLGPHCCHCANCSLCIVSLSFLQLATDFLLLQC